MSDCWPSMVESHEEPESTHTSRMSVSRRNFVPPQGHATPFRRSHFDASTGSPKLSNQKFVPSRATRFSTAVMKAPRFSLGHCEDGLPHASQNKTTIGVPHTR